MKLQSLQHDLQSAVWTPKWLLINTYFAAQNRQKIKQGRRTLPVLNSIPWNTFRLCRQRKAMDTLLNISLFVLLVPFSCFHTRDKMVSCLKYYWVNLQYANESPITYWQWVPMTVGPIVSHADIGVTTLASENILWLPESWLLLWKVLKSACLWLRKGMEMKEIEDQSLKLRANILNLKSEKKNWNKYKRLRFYGHFLAP